MSQEEFDEQALVFITQNFLDEFLINNPQKPTEVYVINESEDEDITNFLEPCPSSFNFSSTGSGASTNLNCIKYGAAYLEISNPPSIYYKCYQLPDLCVATGEFAREDPSTPMGNNTRKYFTAQAMTYAFAEITKENIKRLRDNEPFLTQTEANSLFKEKFDKKLKEFIFSVAISDGECSGNVSTSIPEYNVLGICVPFPCDC